MLLFKLFLYIKGKIYTPRHARVLYANMYGLCDIICTVCVTVHIYIQNPSISD